MTESAAVLFFCDHALGSRFRRITPLGAHHGDDEWKNAFDLAGMGREVGHKK
jgi:hypothetical protein